MAGLGRWRLAAFFAAVGMMLEPFRRASLIKFTYLPCV